MKYLATAFLVIPLMCLNTGCVNPPPTSPSALATPARRPTPVATQPPVVRPPTPAPTTPPGGAAPVDRTVIGSSVEGRPIEMVVFSPANPRETVLIFGGIHGNEQTSVTLTRNLVELLRRQPELIGDKRVIILPLANPDGYAANTRGNANGIDLNRNFEAKNWKARQAAGKRTGYGAAPLSEPESRAIAHVVEKYEPTRICTIHSIDRGRHCNNYDGPGEALAQKMSEANSYPVAETIGYPTPGSFGSWAGVDLQIPTITLELPRDQKGEAAWVDNRDALLAFIRG